ncbi:hypothetical protein [Rhizobium phage RHEph12]|nr:hypothetical protein [Rhizobium phage RHEph12]
MRRLKKPAYHPWEYKVESFPTSATNNPALTIRFDQLGDDEWELVSYDFTQARAVFKRRKEIHNKR